MIIQGLVVDSVHIIPNELICFN